MAGNALNTIISFPANTDIYFCQIPPFSSHHVLKAKPNLRRPYLLLNSKIMPTIAGNVPSSGGSTPQKRRLRSDSVAGDDPICTTPSKPCSPVKWKSPRRCLNDSPRSPPPNRIDSNDKSMKVKKSPVKKLFGSFHEKPIWNPTDSEQLSAVKEALHVSTAPPTIVCRETEQKRVLEFCKQCIEKDKAGSLYMCGLPGTGKSLSMVNVKESLFDWTAESGFQSPDVLAINCTSFSNTSDIFSKILGTNLPSKRTKGSASPLWRLQQLYSKKQASCTKMTLVIADEMDYLITKDRAVLHDLFMLTTFPYSRCILIGIANAIDLADRFLPKLQSLNCKPMVVSFRAYSRDQIIMILKQRLMELPYTVFQPQALELCARKVAAVSGDMRKALCVCRSAIEMVEAELREFTCSSNLTSMEMGISEKQPRASFENLTKNNINIVRVDHMANALSKAYRSPIVESIQSLPQHQQIVLCSTVKHFRRGKKDTTVGELYKSYLDVCKSTLIPPVGIMELSCMCRVLADQGILKLGQSRDDKSRRVTLQIEEADVTFALQGIRFFRNCLQ